MPLSSRPPAPCNLDSADTGSTFRGWLRRGRTGGLTGAASNGSVLHRPRGIHSHAKECLLASHIQRPEVSVAEGAVARILRDGNTSQQATLRRVHCDASAGDIEVALDVDSHAVRPRSEVWNQHPFARSLTVPIEVVGPNVALVGIGYVENFAVWRKRDTVGTALRSRHQLHFLLRRDVVDAVKIQLAILQWREQGIGEIDV